MRASTRRAAALVVVSVVTVGGVLPGLADAKSKVKVSSNVPSVAQHGQALVVSGTVSRVKRRTALRVVLDRRIGTRWRVAARARPSTGGAFTLQWSVPDRGSKALVRVTVRRGGRRLRSTRRARVSFVAAPAPTSPGPATPPAGGEEDFGDLPIDPAEVDGYHVQGNVGGDGFSSRVPLATGTKVKVSQGANGGYSHNRATTRNAVDLELAAGTPVLAGFSGVVAAALGGCAAANSSRCNGGWGNFVLLKNADGTCALHAHLTAINVAAGQALARYGQVGTVGSSGSSTGPHLHYDRTNCQMAATSMPWAFDEAGNPVGGQAITSANEPVPTAPVAVPPSTPSPLSDATRVVTVDNRVTNGGGMREDSTPVRLNTHPWVRCGSRGCNIAATERGSGGQYNAACQTFGERTTNGDDGNPADDGNPERFESSRYYAVRLGDGSYGFVAEAWIRAADRGGLSLPAC